MLIFAIRTSVFHESFLGQFTESCVAIHQMYTAVLFLTWGMKYAVVDQIFSDNQLSNAAISICIG